MYLPYLFQVNQTIIMYYNWLFIMYYNWYNQTIISMYYNWSNDIKPCCCQLLFVARWTVYLPYLFQVSMHCTSVTLMLAFSTPA